MKFSNRRVDDPGDAGGEARRLGEGKRTWRNAVATPNAAAGFNARLTTNIVSVRLVRLDLCQPPTTESKRADVSGDTGK